MLKKCFKVKNTLKGTYKVMHDTEILNTELQKLIIERLFFHASNVNF